MIHSTRRTRPFSCGVSVGQPLAFRAFPRRVPHHEPRHRPDGSADPAGLFGDRENTRGQVCGLA